MREAGQGDVRTLTGLMREFYAESGFDLAEARAAVAFEELLGRQDLGRIWLIERHGEAAGYIVVTFAFAMEHGGRVAVIDDLYVRPQARGEGLGKAALVAARRACEELGLRAVRVEVGVTDTRAQSVYRGAGLEPLPDRRLMQASLAPPSHVA